MLSIVLCDGEASSAAFCHRSPGRALSSPQQGCCHRHHQMKTRRCRPAGSSLHLYHPSGYYRT
ncbi:hypothetical protein T03_11942 [Trichinella britovi]|uniref:Uncharacterized protein n=1 Tax=Trichinella britovi TaxID=45882 RepID=A0A0V1CDI7_TRIBR|nr:hypothetical protein T03_11942 [Trichinella britovi]